MFIDRTISIIAGNLKYFVINHFDYKIADRKTSGNFNFVKIMNPKIASVLDILINKRLIRLNMVPQNT